MLNDWRGIVCKLVRDCSVGVEIGVWRGELSKRLTSMGIDLIMVDPLEKEFLEDDCTMGEGEKTQEELDEIADELSQIPATFLRMPSHEAVRYFNDGSMDFVFIDGSHTYERVKEDIELWKPKVREGGLIMGDDYKGGRHEKKVRRAIRETLGQVNNLEKVWYVHNSRK